MSITQCAFCRGAYTAGCEYCNPAITKQASIGSHDVVAELRAKVEEAEERAQAFEGSFNAAIKEWRAAEAQLARVEGLIIEAYQEAALEWLSERIDTSKEDGE